MVTSNDFDLLILALKSNHIAPQTFLSFDISNVIRKISYQMPPENNVNRKNANSILNLTHLFRNKTKDLFLPS